MGILIGRNISFTLFRVEWTFKSILVPVLKELCN